MSKYIAFWRNIKKQIVFFKENPEVCLFPSLSQVNWLDLHMFCHFLRTRAYKKVPEILSVNLYKTFVGKTKVPTAYPKSRSEVPDKQKSRKVDKGQLIDETLDFAFLTLVTLVNAMAASVDLAIIFLIACGTAPTLLLGSKPWQGSMPIRVRRCIKSFLSARLHAGKVICRIGHVSDFANKQLLIFLRTALVTRRKDLLLFQFKL